MLMVVVQRNEVSRTRFLGFLTILLSVVVLGGIAPMYSSQADPIRFLLLVLSAAALVALVLVDPSAFFASEAKPGSSFPP